MLDVYQREFFESNQGTREFERNNTRISETKRVRNGRLSVDLVYADGGSDHFEWRLYWEQEWRDMLNLCRLEVFALCSEFNEHQAPRATIPRLQLVATKLHRNR